MGAVSYISWTNSTFNPWIGCTKVGPGCDFCYAENWNARFNAGVATNWGVGAPRRRTSVHNWNEPLRWQRKRRALIQAGADPVPHRVFCASLADVFDNEVDESWRRDLFDVIERCEDLEWQIVTKRVGNVAKMLDRIERKLPQNAILIATIVNQEEADRDLPKLIELAHTGVAHSIGVSYEPALGDVNWGHALLSLNWIIIGGESRQGAAPARPFKLSWARNTIGQCQRFSVPVFMKQVGSNLDEEDLREFGGHLIDRAGADPAEWPADLQVQQFPTLSR